MKPTKNDRPKGFYYAIIASLAAVLFFGAIFLLVPKNIHYDSTDKQPASVEYSQEGVSYNVDAIPGEVIVIFNNKTSHREATKIIKNHGGKIIAQRPKNRYYIASVAAGTEGDFMQKVQRESSTIFIYPNAVSKVSMAKPVVLDNFRYVYEDVSASHGEMVDYSYKQGGGDLSIDLVNVGIPDGGYIMSALVEEKLIPILEKANKKRSPVINMSFGCGFRSGYYGLWNDAPKEVRSDYVQSYINGIKELIALVSNYDKKDFVIVKSLGNEGVKKFDVDIMKPLLKSLSSEEKKIFNRHFLLVAAKDDNDPSYSNEMSEGSYNQAVSMTDISDLRFNSTMMHGTSFSSPRVAGFLSRLINDYDITALKALELAKQATRKNKNHLLVYSELEALMGGKAKVEQPSIPEKPEVKGYVDLGLPSGTLWKERFEPGSFDYLGAKDRFGDELPTVEQARELVNNCTATITNYGCVLTGPNGNTLTLPFGLGYYDCNDFFDQNDDGGQIWTSASSDEFFAWCINFGTHGTNMMDDGKCCRFSVCLVKESSDY